MKAGDIDCLDAEATSRVPPSALSPSTIQDTQTENQYELLYDEALCQVESLQRQVRHLRAETRTLRRGHQQLSQALVSCQADHEVVVKAKDDVIAALKIRILELECRQPETPEGCDSAVTALEGADLADTDRRERPAGETLVGAPGEDGHCGPSGAEGVAEIDMAATGRSDHVERHGARSLSQHDAPMEAGTTWSCHRTARVGGEISASACGDDALTNADRGNQSLYGQMDSDNVYLTVNVDRRPANGSESLAFTRDVSSAVSQGHMPSVSRADVDASVQHESGVSQETGAAVPRDIVAAATHHFAVTVPQETAVLPDESGAAVLEDVTAADVSPEIMAGVSSEDLWSTSRERIAKIPLAPEEHAVSMSQAMVSSVPQETVPALPLEIAITVPQERVPEAQEITAIMPMAIVTAASKGNLAVASQQHVTSSKEKNVCAVPSDDVATVCQENVLAVQQEITVADVPQNSENVSTLQPDSVAQSSAAAVPDSVTAGPDSVTAGPDSVTAVPDGVTALPDGVTALPDSVTAVPDGVTAVPDGVTALPDGLTALPDGVTAVPDGVTALPDSVTPVPDGVTALPESVTALPESVTTVPDGVTAVTSEALVITNMPQTIVARENFPIASVTGTPDPDESQRHVPNSTADCTTPRHLSVEEEDSACVQAGDDILLDDLAMSDDEHSSSDDGQSSSDDEHASSGDEQSSLDDEQSSSDGEQSSSDDEQSSSDDEHASSVDEHASSVDEHASSVDEHASSVDGHASSVDEHASSVDGHASSRDGHASSHVGHASSVDGHASSNDGHPSSNDEQASSVDGHESPDDRKSSSHDGHASSVDGQASSDDGKSSSHDRHSSSVDGRPSSGSDSVDTPTECEQEVLQSDATSQSPKDDVPISDDVTRCSDPRTSSIYSAMTEDVSVVGWSPAPRVLTAKQAAPSPLATGLMDHCVTQAPGPKDEVLTTLIDCTRADVALGKTPTVKSDGLERHMPTPCPNPPPEIPCHASTLPRRESEAPTAQPRGLLDSYDIALITDNTSAGESDVKNTSGGSDTSVDVYNFSWASSGHAAIESADVNVGSGVRDSISCELTDIESCTTGARGIAFASPIGVESKEWTVHRPIDKPLVSGSREAHRENPVLQTTGASPRRQAADGADILVPDDEENKYSVVPTGQQKWDSSMAESPACSNDAADLATFAVCQSSVSGSDVVKERECLAAKRTTRRTKSDDTDASGMSSGGRDGQYSTQKRKRSYSSESASGYEESGPGRQKVVKSRTAKRYKERRERKREREDSGEQDNANVDETEFKATAEKGDLKPLPQCGDDNSNLVHSEKPTAPDVFSRVAMRTKEDGDSRAHGRPSQSEEKSVISGISRGSAAGPGHTRLPRRAGDSDPPAADSMSAVKQAALLPCTGGAIMSEVGRKLSQIRKLCADTAPNAHNPSGNMTGEPSKKSVLVNSHHSVPKHNISADKLSNYGKVRGQRNAQSEKSRRDELLKPGGATVDSTVPRSGGLSDRERMDAYLRLAQGRDIESLKGYRIPKRKYKAAADAAGSCTAQGKVITDLSQCMRDAAGAGAEVCAAETVGQVSNGDGVGNGGHTEGGPHTNGTGEVTTHEQVDIVTQPMGPARVFDAQNILNQLLKGGSWKGTLLRKCQPGNSHSTVSVKADESLPPTGMLQQPQGDSLHEEYDPMNSSITRPGPAADGVVIRGEDRSLRRPDTCPLIQRDPRASSGYGPMPPRRERNAPFWLQRSAGHFPGAALPPRFPPPHRPPPHSMTRIGYHPGMSSHRFPSRPHCWRPGHHPVMLSSRQPRVALATVAGFGDDPTRPPGMSPQGDPHCPAGKTQTDLTLNVKDILTKLGLACGSATCSVTDSTAAPAKAAPTLTSAPAPVIPKSSEDTTAVSVMDLVFRSMQPAKPPSTGQESARGEFRGSKSSGATVDKRQTQTTNPKVASSATPPTTRPHALPELLRPQARATVLKKHAVAVDVTTKGMASDTATCGVADMKKADGAAALPKGMRRKRKVSVQMEEPVGILKRLKSEALTDDGKHGTEDSSDGDLTACNQFPVSNPPVKDSSPAVVTSNGHPEDALLGCTTGNAPTMSATRESSHALGDCSAGGEQIAMKPCPVVGRKAAESKKAINVDFEAEALDNRPWAAGRDEAQDVELDDSLFDLAVESRAPESEVSNMNGCTPVPSEDSRGSSVGHDGDSSLIHDGPSRLDQNATEAGKLRLSEVSIIPEETSFPESFVPRDEVGADGTRSPMNGGGRVRSSQRQSAGVSFAGCLRPPQGEADDSKCTDRENKRENKSDFAIPCSGPAVRGRDKLDGGYVVYPSWQPDNSMGSDTECSDRLQIETDPESNAGMYPDENHHGEVGGGCGAPTGRADPAHDILDLLPPADPELDFSGESSDSHGSTGGGSGICFDKPMAEDKEIYPSKRLVSTTPGACPQDPSSRHRDVLRKASGATREASGRSSGRRGQSGGPGSQRRGSHKENVNDSPSFRSSRSETARSASKDRRRTSSRSSDSTAERAVRAQRDSERRGSSQPRRPGSPSPKRDYRHQKDDERHSDSRRGLSSSRRIQREDGARRNSTERTDPSSRRSHLRPSNSRPGR